MTEPLRRFLTATTKAEEGAGCGLFFFFVRLQVNDTKRIGRWRDEGGPAGLCLVFKSTSGGPAWPPFSASMIYHKWNPLTAAFSVAR